MSKFETWFVLTFLTRKEAGGIFMPMASAVRFIVDVLHVGVVGGPVESLLNYKLGNSDRWIYFRRSCEHLRSGDASSSECTATKNYVHAAKERGTRTNRTHGLPPKHPETPVTRPCVYLFTPLHRNDSRSLGLDFLTDLGTASILFCLAYSALAEYSVCPPWTQRRNEWKVKGKQSEKHKKKWPVDISETNSGQRRRCRHTPGGTTEPPS